MASWIFSLRLGLSLLTQVPAVATGISRLGIGSGSSLNIGLGEPIGGCCVQRPASGRPKYPVPLFPRCPVTFFFKAAVINTCCILPALVRANTCMVLISLSVRRWSSLRGRLYCQLFEITDQCFFSRELLISFQVL